jgi:hypothetical protein
MNGHSSKPGTLLSMPGRSGGSPRCSREHSRSHPARYHVAQNVGARCPAGSQGDVLAKHIPVIVLSGLGQANEGTLTSEGAAAFVMKSEKSFENDSLHLIRTVESVLTQSKSMAATAAH